MVDIGKVVAHWRAGATEDWEVATDLVQRGRARHGLFFAHLALEKALKAHVCQRTAELAPYIHDLIRLAAAAGLAVEDRRRDILAKMNAYALGGRYPDAVPTAITQADAESRLRDAREVFEWLMTQLPR
jgi:HEPN domain-containing protein